MTSWKGVIFLHFLQFWIQLEHIYRLKEEMESLDKNHEQKEWDTTLQKIKEYILSLIAKKKKRKEEEREVPTQKEIEKTLTSDSEQELEEKKHTEQEDQEAAAEEKEAKEEVADMETPPEEKDEYIPHDSEL